MKNEFNEFIAQSVPISVIGSGSEFLTHTVPPTLVPLVPHCEYGELQRIVRPEEQLVLDDVWGLIPHDVPLALGVQPTPTSSAAMPARVGGLPRNLPWLAAAFMSRGGQDFSLGFGAISSRLGNQARRNPAQVGLSLTPGHNLGPQRLARPNY